MARGLSKGLGHLLSQVPEKAESPREPAESPKKPEIEEPKMDKVGREGYDSVLIQKAVAKAKKNSTIGVWSPLSAAIFWYLKNSVPNFSISEEIRDLVEKQLKANHPELFEAMKKELEKEDQG
jgi:hypothetical protein